MHAQSMPCTEYPEICKLISVGARCWGQGTALKMAKQSSEEFQKVSEVSCESPLDSPCVHPFFFNLSDSFSFALRPFVFCFRSLASTITL